MGTTREKPSASARVLLAFLLAGVFSFSAFADKFDSVTVFPTSNSVWIETKFTGSASDIYGRIVSAKDNSILWQGSLGHAETNTNFTNHIENLAPALWDLESPNLYYLQVEARKPEDTNTLLAHEQIRFGFRSFEQHGGELFLNGRPIFLRGVAINPPGRTIPSAVGESRQFAEDYVRCLKAAHVNIIRVEHDSQTWFDVCDELGMMAFQGRYGDPLMSNDGKNSPPTNVAASIGAYKELFSTYERHPSIVIYILANELPTSGARGKAFAEYLDKACTALKEWDPTHQYIGNAGYGEGRQGDLNDVHRYWGWYYNTFLTFYNLRNPHLTGDPEKSQPITFSECIGNFTGPTGGYNIIVRKQLAPQLNWTGHDPNQTTAALDNQCRVIREVAEAFRRLRPLNNRIAGLMPFSIFFANWEGIHSVAEMHSTPALEQLGQSYQPILLSWESWQSQVYAGSTIHPIAHMVNDSDAGQPLTNALLEYAIVGPDQRSIFKAALDCGDIAYFDVKRFNLDIALPADIPTGDYQLAGTVSSGGRIVSSNRVSIYIAKPLESPIENANGETVLVDPPGKTAVALQNLQIGFEPIVDFSKIPAKARLVIIGEETWSQDFKADAEPLRAFIQRGGRVLCLRQENKMDTMWLPEPIHFFTGSANDPEYPVRPGRRPFAGNMCINPERPEHPVFQDLDRKRFVMWSDYTDWDQTKPGFPTIYPVTSGFALEKAKSLANTAILANYDHGLAGVGLCEMFSGNGSVLLTGFDLVNRVTLDPVADQMLRNLVKYSLSHTNHFAHPLITEPIQWGNYATERGVVTGPLNGLIVNADWVVPPTDPTARPLKQSQGQWNTRPGDTFLPHGRSALGPYNYSAAATPEDLAPGNPAGIGEIWVRVPEHKKTMVTIVKNPAQTAGEVKITLNGTHTAPSKIAPSHTSTLHTTLPKGQTDLAIRFEATKTLVILETRFE